MVSGFRYEKILVCEDKIENLGFGEAIYGYSFKIQYPNYRGTFVSCIEGLEFFVDGERVPDGDIRFALNGKEFLLDELSALYREYWFILDKATITVMRDGGIAPGQHEVKCHMLHRVPYTGYYGEYMVLDQTNAKTLTVA